MGKFLGAAVIPALAGGAAAVAAPKALSAVGNIISPDIPPPPPPPPAAAADTGAQLEAEGERVRAETAERRRRGRRAAILTSGEGLSDDQLGNIQRPQARGATLLGG